jgi:hypothetical protein
MNNFLGLLFWIFIFSVLVSLYFLVRNSSTRGKRNSLKDSIDKGNTDDIIEKYSSYLKTIKLQNTIVNIDQFYEKLNNSKVVGKFNIHKVSMENQSSIFILSSMIYQDYQPLWVLGGTTNDVEQNMMVLLRYNPDKNEFDVYSDRTFTDLMIKNYYLDFLEEIRSLLTN